MLAEAIYNDGKIELTKNVQFKHTRFKLQVELPDDEIVEEIPQNISPVIMTQAQEMLAKFDAIRNLPLSSGDVEELTEKQQQRLEAMKLRVQIRMEEGRPV